MNIEEMRTLVYTNLPDRLQSGIEREAQYAHIPNPEQLTFNIYAVSFIILTLFVLLFEASPAAKIAGTVIFVPIALVAPYMLFSLMANKRRKQVEDVLPDALNLISANIESGMTIEKAFLLGARDEFGPLADDLERTSMRIFGGTPVDEALKELEDETNSEMFEETLRLLRDGLDAGGQISDLLESSANDVQKSLHLRDEIAANVKMYSLFILMASVFGAPILFAVSVFLTESTASLWGSQSINFDELPSAGLLEFQQPDFRPEFFADFALVAIIISNIFAALIISEIKNGNIKEGIKYIPVFVILSTVVFFTASTAINAVIGGFV
ncbi:MAG: type II secretion system F family protein [Candidatus Nanohaloarchaeota archaeon QJJ-5]|nr:type II secretion system F family protein [Candidatus Nanohaloarchaeota archaeon QJJ-5]